jgi:hypothetical protein
MANRENEVRTSATAPRLAAESIVDLMFSLPEDAAQQTDAVDRAVASRRQVELANRMRSMIGDDDHRQAA